MLGHRLRPDVPVEDPVVPQHMQAHDAAQPARGHRRRKVITPSGLMAIDGQDDVADAQASAFGRAVGGDADQQAAPWLLPGTDVCSVFTPIHLGPGSRSIDGSRTAGEADA